MSFLFQIKVWFFRITSTTFNLYPVLRGAEQPLSLLRQNPPSLWALKRTLIKECCLSSQPCRDSHLRGRHGSVIGRHQHHVVPCSSSTPRQHQAPFIFISMSICWDPVSVASAGFMSQNQFLLIPLHRIRKLKLRGVIKLCPDSHTGRKPREPAPIPTWPPSPTWEWAWETQADSGMMLERLYILQALPTPRYPVSQRLLERHLVTQRHCRSQCPRRNFHSGKHELISLGGNHFFRTLNGTNQHPGSWEGIAAPKTPLVWEAQTLQIPCYSSCGGLLLPESPINTSNAMWSFHKMNSTFFTEWWLCGHSYLLF